MTDLIDQLRATIEHYRENERQREARESLSLRRMLLSWKTTAML